MSSNYLVKSNDFDIAVNEEVLQSADVIRISENEYNLIYQNRSVNVQLRKLEYAGKYVELELDGETFKVEIRDELDQMLEKMGFNNTVGKHIRDVKAPMPGLVVELSVKEGQALKEGERILILSAMKMENSILLQTDGIIKKIHVVAGQPVEKGQLLVELE